LRPIWRVLILWVASAVLLVLLAWLFPGFHLKDFWSALGAAAILGLFNALVWPLLVRFALPLTVLTLGLLPLFLNGATVLLVAWIVPGVSVDGFWWAFAVAVGLTLLGMVFNAVFALQDDDVVVWHLLKKNKEAGSSEEPTGVVFLQIDGLAHPVLQRAIRDGNAPTLAGWVQRGSHHLTGWVTDWSSQTGVSQAGILLGSNDDMPAFRWMEKENNRVFISNRPRHAAEIERRHSNGKGLLFADGASRGNIFTGDAEDSVLTMASAGRKHGRIGAGYYTYFSQPYTTMRTVIGVIAEASREIRQSAQQRRRDVRPRVHRGGVYPLLRSFTTVITRDVIVATLVGDMRAGRSVMYADFVGYDEVSHHSGVERYDALETLRRLDREFARLERAAATTNRQYEFVVLSDHGQSQGATFLARYGESLGELVERTIGAPTASAGEGNTPPGEESWGYAGGALQEISAGPGLAAKAVAAASKGKRDDAGDVVIGVKQEDPAGSAAPAVEGEDKAVVMASGSCGLVYLTRDSTRMTKERIDELYPSLLDTLRHHPGVGFLLVRSESRGALVLGANGEIELDNDVLIGEDPLAPFGDHARRQVRHTDSFPHCADVMLNSLWDPQTGEVAAFEELVGSHGGLGGDQTHPFLLYPASWPAPQGELFGAVAVHHQLRRWLSHVGQTAYDDEAVEPRVLTDPVS
jgi:uncharacterized membrane protein YvlD (DUF360 family)